MTTEKKLQVGDKAPHFEQLTDEGLHLSTADLLGKWYVLYFYPKDSTPGCTTEGRNFRDLMSSFEALKVRVIGVSRDSVSKHQQFKASNEFNFTLLSDESGALCRYYGVLVEKSMFGKPYLGIERSTFLVNPDGNIAHIWRKVKVKSHVKAVLAVVQSHVLA